MHNLVHLYSPGPTGVHFGHIDVTNTRHTASVCRWPHVRCADGVIESVRWEVNLAGTGWMPQFFGARGCVAIDWLPPHLKEFEIVNAEVNTVIHTARLPSSMREFTAQSCELYGSVDLQRLPPAMRHFNASLNSLSGGIVLLSLPPTIQHIDLQYNPITAVVFSSERMPKSLYRVLLYANGEKIRMCGAGRGEKSDKRIQVRGYGALV